MADIDFSRLSRDLISLSSLELSRLLTPDKPHQTPQPESDQIPQPLDGEKGSAADDVNKQPYKKLDNGNQIDLTKTPEKSPSRFSLEDWF